MARGEDLTGRRFGKLTVLERTPERRNHYILWRCQCDCGNEVLKSTKQLKCGENQSCGCEQKTAQQGNIAEDLTGQVFGELTVLRQAENKNGRTCWLCRCKCGKEKVVLSRDLKAGKVKSCGCMVRAPRRNRMDIKGKKFGRLTVLYSTGEHDRKGSIYWHCRCICGNEIDVTQNQLMHGNYQSCGCLKEENQKRISTRSHRIDGTCIEILEKRKHRKDNRSGFRGVCQMKNGKYRVDIGFKRKRYHIGTFKDFDKAVQMRLIAEHLLHDGFVKAYYEWKERAEKDPEWGEQNPLRFEIDWEKIFPNGK